MRTAAENPALQQGAVMCRAGDFVKETGGDWIRVLRVEGRNIYLDYDDGLNCLDADDVIAWKHGTQKINKTNEMKASQKYYRDHIQIMPLSALREPFIYNSDAAIYGKICELEGKLEMIKKLHGSKDGCYAKSLIIYKEIESEIKKLTK